MLETQRAQILEEFESVSKVIIQKHDDDDSSNNAIINFQNYIQIVRYVIAMVVIEAIIIRYETDTCNQLDIALEFGIGGIHKLESSSNLTKNHLAESEDRPWGSFQIIVKDQVTK